MHRTVSATFSIAMAGGVVYFVAIIINQFNIIATALR